MALAGGIPPIPRLAIEPGDEVRGDVQAGFRAVGPFHQAEGRHQRMRGAVRPVGWAKGHVEAQASSRRAAALR
jgi:hypothetical protein